MPETIRTDWPDIWYTAFHEVDGIIVNFRIHAWDGALVGDGDDLTPVFEADEKPVMAGYVKWDGCNEWDTADGSLHFCARDGAQKLAQAMERCWDLADATFQRKTQ